MLGGLRAHENIPMVADNCTWNPVLLVVDRWRSSVQSCQSLPIRFQATCSCRVSASPHMAIVLSSSLDCVCGVAQSATRAFGECSICFRRYDQLGYDYHCLRCSTWCSSGLHAARFMSDTMSSANHALQPNQSAAANRRPAGQSDGSDNSSATVAADRAFPAAVAELGR